VSMIDKKRIIQLLGTGLQARAVANAVGCEESYISQLLSDEVISGEVVALRAAALTANTERDGKIDTIEDALLSRLHDAIETGQIYKPGDILRAFAVTNAAKRRGVPANEAVTLQQTVVQLQIPERVARQFTINQSGEVVDVETGTGETRQTLVTMSTHTLLSVLANRGEKKDGAENKYVEVSKYLPGAAVESQKRLGNSNGD
jgi:hypothetical protein